MVVQSKRVYSLKKLVYLDSKDTISRWLVFGNWSKISISEIEKLSSNFISRI